MLHCNQGIICDVVYLLLQGIMYHTLETIQRIDNKLKLSVDRYILLLLRFLSYNTEVDSNYYIFVETISSKPQEAKKNAVLH